MRRDRIRTIHRKLFPPPPREIPIPEGLTLCGRINFCHAVMFKFGGDSKLVTINGKRPVFALTDIFREAVLSGTSDQLIYDPATDQQGDEQKASVSPVTGNDSAESYRSDA